MGNHVPKSTKLVMTLTDSGVRALSPLVGPRSAVVLVCFSGYDRYVAPES